MEVDLEPLSLLDFLCCHSKVTVGHGSHVPEEPGSSHNDCDSGTDESNLVD